MPRPPSRRGFEADAVAREQRQAVGHRVAALHGDPRIALAILLVLRHRPDPSRSRWDTAAVPRRPAPSGARASGYHWSQHTSTPSRPTEVSIGSKAEVAGREVELLVEGRIVRDVHLAILAGDRARAVEHHRGVVVQPGRAPLEQRRDDDELAAPRPACRCVRCSGPEWLRRDRIRRRDSCWQKYGPLCSSCSSTSSTPAVAASRRPASIASRLASRLPRLVSCSSATLRVFRVMSSSDTSWTGYFTSPRILQRARPVARRGGYHGISAALDVSRNHGRRQ